MDINQTSLPFLLTSSKGRCYWGIGNTMVKFPRERHVQGSAKPGYCSTKNSWKLMWKKTDLFWVLRSKPNRVLGLPVLIWAPDFVLRPRGMTCWSCAPGSLDSTSAPGYLHSLGITTQPVLVPFGFGFFSKTSSKTWHFQELRIQSTFSWSL